MDATLYIDGEPFSIMVSSSVGSSASLWAEDRDGKECARAASRFDVDTDVLCLAIEPFVEEFEGELPRFHLPIEEDAIG